MQTTAEQLPDLRKQANSVTSGEDGLYHFIIPWTHNSIALPPEIPVSGGLYGFDKARDKVLLSTPRYEGQWASAISTAISRTASMAWEIESDTPLRRKRYQEMLLNFHAGMGIYGWIPGLSIGMRGFLTIGYQIIEIERATGARGSRALALHHLNPLKCCFTGDNQYPIEYLNGNGESFKIPWHNLIIMVDSLNPDSGSGAIAESAAERAYHQIKKLAAIESYVYEKVSGRRPQAIYFVGGVTNSTISDAIANAQNSANAGNMQSYMGAAMVPVMGDIPVSIASIPLAELPDGFDAVAERLRADLIYASAIGLDAQAVNPQLLGSQGMGSTGNQSQVLENKEKQSGLAAWRQQFTHQINQMLMDDKTTFAFKEVDFTDRQSEAAISKTEVDTAGVMVDKMLITPEQATNYLVDKDVLPIEFITEDATAGDTLTDTQKLGQEDEKIGTAADKVEPKTPEDTPPLQGQEVKKSAKIWHDLIY